MKNANKRPYWSQNADDDRPTLTESIIHFIVAAIAFYVIIVMFGCSNKLHSGKNYTLPNGQVLEAYKHAIFIKDIPKRKLISVYLESGITFVSDTTVNGGN